MGINYRTERIFHNATCDICGKVVEEYEIPKKQIFHGYSVIDQSVPVHCAVCKITAAYRGASTPPTGDE